MDKTDSLIRTKFRLPFIRPGLVTRPRLQACIAEGLLYPLTLVIAPAGFGKTTLVAASLVDCQIPVAWLSLDRGDNLEGRFLSYLIAALQSANPGIGKDASQLMEGLQPAPPEAVMTSLINDLDNAAGQIALVLEDYQFISSQSVHSELTFLLEHCPGSLHVLVVTRSDPPLPLARLRARGQMVELRAADLRFTPFEASQFLNDVMGLDLDEGSVEILEERTEGWVAGLQMAALSMHNRADIRGFINGFSGTNRHILDYMMEEILAHQEPEVQLFLLHTSILERLTAPLCDAVQDININLDAVVNTKPLIGLASSRQSASILAYLQRENIFLVSLDDKEDWFRYHHLFADLLKARLQQAHPDWVPRLHTQASIWLEQNGYITEAIQHLLSANDVEGAATLIERYEGERWSVNDLSVVRMAESLPREIIFAHPKIGLYQAWLFINQGFVEKALPLLNDLVRQFTAATSNPDLKWMQTFLQLVLAFLYHQERITDPDPLPGEQALYDIPTSEPVLCDAAEILYGMALGRRGDYNRAAEFSVKCIQKRNDSHGALAHEIHSISTMVPFLATIYWFQGRLHSAESLCQEYLDKINEKGIRISTAGTLDVILGEVLYDRNFLEEAEHHLRAGLLANELWKNIMTDAFGLLALIHVLIAKSDFSEAMRMVDKFEIRLQSQTRPAEFSEDFHTIKVRVELARGDVQSAVLWADQIQHSEEYRRHPEYYLVTLARIRVVQGRFAEVEETLAEIATQDLAGNRIARQIESKLLLAIAIAGQQRLPEAFTILQTCLDLAEPEGYNRIFLDIGEPIKELLSAYLRSNAFVHKPYAQKILNAFSQQSGVGSTLAPQTELIEPLSAREREVLHYIAIGRTNLEIAQQLIVSRGTIKAHTANIFRKLDVTNRTEAVARARKLGILT